MLLTQTPLRMSLVGGGLDYPDWYTQHGGLVTGGAINQFGRLLVRHLPPFHEHKSRFIYSEMEVVQSTTEIRHKAIKACVEMAGLTDAGLEVFNSSDLPAGSGTGSSSTFVVGLLNSLYATKSLRLSAHELATRAIEVERKILAEAGGVQDQVFAAYGGLNVIEFRKNGEITPTPLRLKTSQIKELEEHLLLFFTGRCRNSSAVIAECRQNVTDQWTLMRLAEQSITFLENGRYERLGWAIDQSWRLKVRLSPKVADEHITNLYTVSRVYGAWGGKLMGAGGGGCLLLVAPPHKQEGIIKQLEERGCLRIPFRFEESGSHVVYYRA